MVLASTEAARAIIVIAFSVVMVVAVVYGMRRFKRYVKSQVPPEPKSPTDRYEGWPSRSCCRSCLGRRSGVVA
jgi:hypothetical protein